MSGVLDRFGHLGHLSRRFLGSLSSRPPTSEDETWARRHLLSVEVEWWARMRDVDRRHAVHVARRFQARRPEATRAEIAGALLHDVGKVESDLGTVARVVATVVGPRTARFRRYHDHERIGADLLRRAGSDPVTIELVGGHGAAADDLRAADDV